MKKQLFLPLFLTVLTSCFTACNDNDDDNASYQTITFESATTGNLGYVNNIVYQEGSLSFYNTYDETYDYWTGTAISEKTDRETEGYVNQYSVYGSGGANNSSKFAIVTTTYANSFFSTDGSNFNPQSAYFSLTTYTYLSTKNGDSFAKKFADGDWFCVTLKGYDAADELVGTVAFYPIDYRDGQKRVFDKWTKVDLSNLGQITSVVAEFSSSDTGEWGVNTPTFIAMDDLVVYSVEN